MTDNEYGGDAAHPHIDADAVCERCGTVNPEDTLLCKTCGNNLRDQRTRRVAEGRMAVAPESEGGGEWLRRGLALFGILVVIWVALNVDTITNWMISIQTPVAAQQYWTGTGAERYEALASQLKANPVSSTELPAAQENDAPGFDGRYILMARGSAAGSRPLGEAAAQQDGDVLYFVAHLNNGIELRGFAAIEGGNRLNVKDSAGVKERDTYYDVSGLGLKQGAVIECMGFITSESDQSFSAIAYRVP